MQDGLRLVAYNFLSGGSAKRAGQWSRVLRTLEPDVVFGEECRPTGDQLSLPTLGGDDAPSDDRPPPRNRWAWLLAHVSARISTSAPVAVGPMRWVEAALTQPSTARLLAEYGMGPRSPPLVHRHSSSQLSLPFARCP